MNLENIFENHSASLPINASITYDDDSFFVAPAQVSGEVRNTSGIVVFNAQFKTFLHFNCDRCAQAVDREYEGQIHQTLVKSLQSDEDSDLIVLPDAHLDLSEALREELYLQCPAKLLCDENCKGLCPTCGANLNIGVCTCPKQVDPRLSALLDLEL